MTVLYWFGWSSSASAFNPDYDIIVKLLKISDEEKQKREKRRKPMAKLLMVLYTAIVLLLFMAMLIQNNIIPWRF